MLKRKAYDELLKNKRKRKGTMYHWCETNRENNTD